MNFETNRHIANYIFFILIGIYLKLFFNLKEKKTSYIMENNFVKPNNSSKAGCFCVSKKGSKALDTKLQQTIAARFPSPLKESNLISL